MQQLSHSEYLIICEGMAIATLAMCMQALEREEVNPQEKFQDQLGFQPKIY